MHNNVRTGIGYDAHRFDQARKLVLGGVEIPGHPGLAGHSDADVLAHAIADALLGACGLDDIGTHFPDTSPDWLGISSLVILAKVAELAERNGFAVSNVDSTIVAESPRLCEYYTEMRRNIATALDISPSQVNVKATTTEKMGFAGRKEGIAAYAVATVVSTALSQKNMSVEDGSREKLVFPGTIYKNPPRNEPNAPEIAKMLSRLPEAIFNTDGATSGNPGPSGCAIILSLPDGEPVCGFSWHIGRATNNVAEYTAVLELLRWLDGLAGNKGRIRIRMDSELVQRQLAGKYKVKSPELQPYWAEASEILARMPEVSLDYIPRGQNAFADHLARSAARKKH
ncbi:MAG: 2-C-methyl-D-erythritol 2,4-cyclodiphosphate synthase [bacterium]